MHTAAAVILVIYNTLLPQRQREMPTIEVFKESAVFTVAPPHSSCHKANWNFFI